MAQLLQAPYSQFFDANGVPLAGGKVYTYVAGTGYVTPQASYTDSTGGTPAANPVVLDSAGRAAIWLSGSYGIVVKDSLGNIIMSTDGITTSGSAATSTFLDGSFLIENTSDATKKVAFDASGITTGTQRTIAIPDKNGTLAMTSDISGKTTLYQVTDASDISLSAAPTQSNVGSTKSITIPAKGVIALTFFGEMIWSASASRVTFGIRIGSTNYWPVVSPNGGSTYLGGINTVASGGTGLYPAAGITNASGNSTGSAREILSIEQLAIPAGVQTVQVIAAKDASSTSTLKGTVITSLVNIEVMDFS